MKRFIIQGSASEIEELYTTGYYLLYSEYDSGLWTAMNVPTIGVRKFPSLTNQFSRHEYPVVPAARIRWVVVDITDVYPANSQTSLHIELYGCDAPPADSGK